VFEARIKGGGDSTIYEHQFVHTLSNPSLALLARLMLRRRIEAESTRTLRGLKTALELTRI